MKYLKAYIKENMKWLLAILFSGVVMAVVMALNNIAFFEIVYGMFVCLAFTVIITGTGLYKYYGCCKRLEELEKVITVSTDSMPQPEYQYEAQYQECIRLLEREKGKILNEMLNRQQELSEYYSMWVHQIKTPIAALKLLIDEEANIENIAENDTFRDTSSDFTDNVADDSVNTIFNTEKKQQELFKIEQYVDMVLQYIRLGSATNDFVIKKTCLDDVIRSTIHKYARQFVYKKLSLTYKRTQFCAVTDEKWLGFVIGQLLSNAIKYTKSGGITIDVYDKESGAEGTEDNNVIWIEKKDIVPCKEIIIAIEDTGIGINAEDLPRVCEMGYTGNNGHGCTTGVDGSHDMEYHDIEYHATGIGLYLCRQVLDKLGHKLRISSTKGVGTRIEIVILWYGLS